VSLIVIAWLVPNGSADAGENVIVLNDVVALLIVNVPLAAVAEL
jgi:hypothetical protein